MFDWNVYVYGLVAVLGMMSLLWLISLWRRDVSIVDAFWAPAFWVLAVSYAWTAPDEQAAGTRMLLVLLLSGLWALRLAGYIFWRN